MPPGTAAYHLSSPDVCSSTVTEQNCRDERCTAVWINHLAHSAGERNQLDQQVTGGLTVAQGYMQSPGKDGKLRQGVLQ